MNRQSTEKSLDKSSLSALTRSQAMRRFRFCNDRLYRNMDRNGLLNRIVHGVYVISRDHGLDV
jgi:uncharacterized protein YehS (DUF1456 family)